MKRNVTTVQNIAQNEINKSSNPLGINFEIPRFTVFRAVRLLKRARKPDKLKFLKTYRGFGRKFDKPVLHTTEGALVRLTDSPLVAYREVAAAVQRDLHMNILRARSA